MLFPLSHLSPLELAPSSCHAPFWLNPTGSWPGVSLSNGRQVQISYSHSVNNKEGEAGNCRHAANNLLTKPVDVYHTSTPYSGFVGVEADPIASLLHTPPGARVSSILLASPPDNHQQNSACVSTVSINTIAIAAYHILPMLHSSYSVRYRLRVF